MDLKYLNLEEEIIDDSDNFFFVRKGEIKYIKFIYGIESFFGFKMHVVKEDGNYKKYYCDGDCKVCSINNNKSHVFIPVCECDMFGKLLNRNVLLWDSYKGFYKYIMSLDKSYKDKLSNFHLIIDRRRGFYDYYLSYTVQGVFNNDLNKFSKFEKDYFGKLVKDNYTYNK